MKIIYVKDILAKFYKIYYSLNDSIKNANTAAANKFRLYYYKKVINALNELSQNDKVDKKLIDNLNISDNMKLKILDMMRNTRDSTTRDMQNTRDSTTRNMQTMRDSTTRNMQTMRDTKHILLNKLTEIKGIGEQKAKKLIDEGLTAISQLKNKKWQDKLSDETKLYLKYKPENKIPHEEIRKLEKLIRKKINYDFVIVGSYRRKKEFSRDIDIMLIEPDNSQIDNSQINLLTLFLEKLKTLADVYCYSKGNSKLSTIIKLNNKFYKLDIFKVKKENMIPMLIYTTGSKEFNIKMRAQAKKLGYLLNQNGLFKNKVKINLQTEKAYFDILKIKYLEPDER
jgi:DNA polymerase/3'-5' exonuclease PolX